MIATNKEISLRQLQLLIILSAMGTGIIILPAKLYNIAGRGGWMLVIALAVAAVLMGVLVAVGVRGSHGFLDHVGKPLTRPVAYICGVLLWGKLVFSAGLELRSFLDITHVVMLPKTPLWAVAVLMVLVCTYAAVKGMETRARVAEILVGLMVLPFVFLVGLAFWDVDFKNIGFDLEFNEGVGRIFGLGFIFTGLECLLLVPPFIRKGKSMTKHVAIALGFSAFLILVITFLTFAKFGAHLGQEPWPVLRMMDMLNLPGSFIERQEVLIFSFWIITAFAIGNTFIFFGGVLVKDICKPKTKHIGVYVTAAAVLIVTLIPWGDVYGLLNHLYIFGGSFFLIILPVLLIICKRDGGAKKSGLALALLLPLMLTACWDSVEIEDRGFVVAIGIDRAGEEYAISLSVPVLKKDDEAHHVITAQGATIAETFAALDADIDKHLYYGQAKLLILGQDLLNHQQMTATAIRDLAHNNQIDMRINVLAASPSAHDVLEQEPVGESLPGLYIADIYRNKTQLAEQAVDLESLHREYVNGIFLPMVETTEDGENPLALEGTMFVHGVPAE